MAAYAALVCLINTIDQSTTHPRLSKSLDNKLTQTLLQKTTLLLDFIEAHNYGVGSKEAEDLERQIASAAHAVEDAIESHFVDQIHAGTCEVLLTMEWMIQEMDIIMETAKKVKEKRGLKEERSTHPAAPPLVVESGEAAMVGFDDELIRLLDELTGYRSSRHTVSIVGMGGMGKTTLAKNVYENPLIKQHFDIRAWATISQRYDVKEILSQLLFGQGKSYDKNAEDLRLELHKTLTGRRYLIVLDDVWSVEVWDEVRRFFPDNGNRSRVVLTTRLSDVATDCGSCCFKKKLLDENESWRLFCKKAFQHEDCPPELEGVGKEIVESCKGLPLSIVVAGGSLLKSPRTVGHWEDVAKDIKSIPNSKEKQESLDVLFSSYNHLPPHLKPCFLYMGVFKWRYSRIPVSEIIRLWVAEGFLKSSGARVLEEIAGDYIKDLIDRNLIFVGRRSDAGKVKSCDIHDLLRDLCLSLAEQQGFVHVSECEIGDRNHRRLIYSKKCGLLETGSPLARSVMGTQVDEQALDEFRLLRVLKLSMDNFRTRKNFKCVNLRYLDYQGVVKLSTPKYLPWNLQTVIFIGQIKASDAPIEIWRMQRLRHLKCTLSCLPDPYQSEGYHEYAILENLQTLKGIMNLKLSEEVCKLIPNIKKLGLSYSESEDGYDILIDCLHNLGRLHKLETLRLTVFSDGFINKELRLPRSLSKLSLHVGRFDWGYMSMIGSLPLLQVLKLDFVCAMEGGEWEWSPIDGEFLHLKFLKIDCRPGPTHWNGDCSHFPVLERLYLVGFENIPWGIGEIPTLQLLCVKWSSMSAAISAVKLKEERLEYDEDDHLQILINLYPSEDESFKELVQREGLTINNIRLEIGF